jgi:PBP1b-binding outer membrane lipoprotein LpoB
MQARRIMMAVLMAAGLAVFATGCKSEGHTAPAVHSSSSASPSSTQPADHPKSDHPKNDHPDHPK